MRFLVVSLTNHLAALLSVLDPELDVCAIVVDDLDSAEPIAAKCSRIDNASASDGSVLGWLEDRRTE